MWENKQLKSIVKYWDGSYVALRSSFGDKESLGGFRVIKKAGLGLRRGDQSKSKQEGRISEHVVRPIPLYKMNNCSRYLQTYLTDFGPPLPMAIYLWYIEGPDKNILVDAGGTVDTYSPSLPGLSPHATLENVQSCEEGLSRLGLRPEDIDIVILTHMHLDHVELARKFTKAKFIVQKAELDFANNPHPVIAAPYVKPFFEGLNFEVIEGDKEIVEGVRVLFTPGHSAWGQSVVIDTAKGTAIISGFCCIRENFELPEPLKEVVPIILPGIHLNPIELYDNVLKVKSLADILIPIHDVESVDKTQIP